MTNEKKNAKQLPKVYYCRHMLNGVVKYESEMILVDVDDMKRMVKSFAGKPVYVMHQPVIVENIECADGYVSDCFYNALDGWLWAKFVAVTDAAHEAIEKGWGVSNAYIPKMWDQGGVHQNVDYDRKIVNAEFTHLAIVPDPRYEGSKIFTAEQFEEYQASKKAEVKELHNSKEHKTMFKLFKNAKTEVTEIDDETMVELENGKSVALKEMINAVKKNQDDAKKEKEEKMNMDMEIEVGEEKIPLKELINRYMKSQKSNEADETKAEDKAKENEADEAKKAEEEKKNAEEEAKKKEEEKKNAKHFEELKNAQAKAETSIRVDTSLNMMSRGQNRYGSKK